MGINAKQLDTSGDGVRRENLNVTDTGSAVTAKIVEGTAINLSSTGVDAGTGDVTIAVDLGTGSTQAASGDHTHSGYALSSHSHAESDITNLVIDLGNKLSTSLKGATNGLAELGADGKVPSGQLPSYVDDVLEVADYASLPVTGVAGIIYVTLDTNKCYRWGGSSYTQITSGAVDSVAGKTGVVTLAKADVGLGNVDNTSDANKPISSATQTALNGKSDTGHTHDDRYYTETELSTSGSATVDWGNIANEPATYTPSAHTHGGGDITTAVAEATNADTLDSIHSSGFVQPATSQTVNIDSSMTATQIQALWDAIPRYLPTGVTVTIQAADGTYTPTAALTLRGFYGGGSLILQGNTGETDATALHTTQSVIFDFSASNVPGLYIRSNACQVTVQNLHIKVKGATSSTYRAFNFIQNSVQSIVRYNYAEGESASYGYGFLVDGAPAYVYNNYVSNIRVGIIAQNGCEVFALNNDDTGIQPAYGLCAAGAVIRTNSVYPAGSTASKYSESGGDIRGAETVWTSENDGSGSGSDSDMVDGIHGTVLAQKITSTTSITVGPSGRDYTTIQAALDSLKGKVLSAVVTINVDAGDYAIFSHGGQPYGRLIQVVGDTRTAAGAQGIATGSISKDGDNCTITLTAAPPSNFGSSDYVTVADCTTAANIGRFPIVSIDTVNFTVTYTNASGVAEAVKTGTRVIWNPNRTITSSGSGVSANFGSDLNTLKGFTFLGTSNSQATGFSSPVLVTITHCHAYNILIGFGGYCGGAVTYDYVSAVKCTYGFYHLNGCTIMIYNLNAHNGTYGLLVSDGSVASNTAYTVTITGNTTGVYTAVSSAITLYSLKVVTGNTTDYSPATGGTGGNYGSFIKV